MLQAHLLHNQRSFGRFQPGFGGFVCGGVLVDLLLAQGAAGLQRAGLVCIARSVQCVGLGLGKTGLGLRHFGIALLGCKTGQHLALGDPVAHIDPDIDQPQAAGFAANDGLLPGKHTAIGCQFERQRGLHGLYGGHCQRCLGRVGCSRLFVICSTGF